MPSPKLVTDDAAPTSTTFDRLLARSPRTGKVTLTVRPEDADRLARAREELDQARQLASLYPDDDTYRGRLEEAQDKFDKVDASAVRFTVTMSGIGPSRVKELIAAHPPTKEQKTKARAASNGNPASDPQFNIDTFAPVLLAAVVQSIEFSDDPQGALTGLTEEQAATLWKESKWSEGDRIVLFNTAMQLDDATSLVEDLGKD